MSRTWWYTPVVTATWEAEAQESLESGRQRLQQAKTVSLHSTLGVDTEQACIKKTLYFDTEQDPVSKINK